MEKIEFVIDSSTELTDELKNRGDVSVAQDYVNFPDGRSIPDSGMVELGGTDWLVDEMADSLKNRKELPKTSQPTPGDFNTIFSEIMEKGCDDVLPLLLPIKKSGTWNSANQAIKNFPDFTQKILELRTISSATTLVLEEVVSAYDNGASFEEIRKVAMDANNAVEGYFTVNDLIYLEKGGRIGKAKRLIGSLLNFKPLIKLGRDKDKDEYGDFIEVPEKVRTMKKTVARLGELITDAVGDGRKYVVSAGKSLLPYAMDLKNSLSNAEYLPPTSGALVANGGPFIIVTGLPENYRK